MAQIPLGSYLKSCDLALWFVIVICEILCLNVNLDLWLWPQQTIALLIGIISTIVSIKIYSLKPIHIFRCYSFFFTSKVKHYLCLKMSTNYILLQLKLKIIFVQYKWLILKLKHFFGHSNRHNIVTNEDRISSRCHFEALDLFMFPHLNPYFMRYYYHIALCLLPWWKC